MAELEPERQVCFKVNSDDPTMDYPSFSSLFEILINAVDLLGIQSVKDQLRAIKPNIGGSRNPHHCGTLVLKMNERDILKMVVPTR